jgi:hypothetical protein
MPDREATPNQSPMGRRESEESQWEVGSSEPPNNELVERATQYAGRN